MTNRLAPRCASFALFALLLLAPGISFGQETASVGNWNGLWEGGASFSDNVSVPEFCETVAIAIAQSERTFEHYYSGRCGTQAWEDLVALEIVGNDLYLEGRKVGTLTENQASYSLEEPENEFTFSVSLGLSPEGSLSIHDKVTHRLYRSQLVGILPRLDLGLEE